MLAFELKKQYKNKLYIILILFSIAISIYNLSTNNFTNVFINNEIESAAYGNLLEEVSLTSDIISDLSENKKEEIVDEYTEYSINFVYPWEDEKNTNEEYARKMLETYREHYLYQDNLINKYNIKLDTDTENTWEWGLFESKYMIDTKTPYGNSFMSQISINPIRTIIYNDAIMFGLSIIILIAFVFSGIISEEKQSNTFLLLKGQPIKKINLVFAKWLSIIIYGIIFIFLTTILTIILFILFGYNWHNGHLEIYRIFSDNNLDYTVAYKLLIQIIFASIIMIAFFSSLIILFSSLFKNKYLSAIIISLILVIFTIFTSKYDLFRSIYNPFYLLNFKNILNGFISMDFNLQITDYSYVKAYGFHVYYIYLGMSILLLLASIYVLDRDMYRSKREYNRIEIKSIFALEYYKILKDKSFLITLIGVLSIFTILFVDTYIMDVKQEAVLYSKHYTPLMNYYKSSKTNRIKSDLYSIIANKNHFIESYGNDEYKKEIDRLEKNLSEELDKLENYRIETQYYEDKDGANFYKLRVDQINDLLSNNVIVPTVKLKNFLFRTASHKETLALYKYMRENDNEPKVIVWPVFSSEYEEKTVANEIDGFDNVFDHSSSYIFRRLAKTYPLDIIILLMVSLMILGGYTYDKENGNQIDLLYTQPLRKEKLYLLKTLSTFVISIIILVIILIFLGFLGFVTKGIGDLNYPIIQYDNLVNASEITMYSPVYFSIIPIFLYNLRLFLLLILQLLLVISIGNLISMFTKNRFIVYIGTWATIIIGAILSIKLPDNIRLYSPFTYMNSRYIANGAVKIKENLSGANLYLIISVILISVLIINIIGMYLSKKIEQ